LKLAAVYLWPDYFNAKRCIFAVDGSRFKGSGLMALRQNIAFD